MTSRTVRISISFSDTSSTSSVTPASRPKSVRLIIHTLATPPTARM